MRCYSHLSDAHRQSRAQKMPGLQDPFPSDPQRAWQRRRANPVRLVLQLVLESRPSKNARAECRTVPIASFVGRPGGFATDLFRANRLASARWRLCPSGRGEAGRQADHHW
jgi:hypothetical protein